MDFQLQLVPMARVEGRSIYPAGQDSGGVQVQLVNSSARTSRYGRQLARAPTARADSASTASRPGSTRCRANRRAGSRWARSSTSSWAGVAGAPVDLALLAGTLALRARGRPRVGRARLWATAEISVDGRNLSERRADVAAVVLDRLGRLEFRGTTTQPPADLTRIRVTLTPSDPTAAGRAAASAAAGRVDENGHFTIDGVVPGRYRLSVGRAAGLVARIRGPRRTGRARLPARHPLEPEPVSGGRSPSPTSRRHCRSQVATAQGQAVSDYTLIIYPTDQRYWLPQSRRIRSIRPATDGLLRERSAAGRLSHRAGPRSGPRLLVRPRVPPAARQCLGAVFT